MFFRPETNVLIKDEWRYKEYVKGVIKPNELSYTAVVFEVVFRITGVLKAKFRSH